MSQRSARVVHHVKGRIRVKLQDAKGNHRFLESVKQTLSPVAGVRNVDVNSSTGSVVVHYDQTTHPDFAQTLASHCESEGLFSLEPPELSEVDAIANKLQREAQFLAQHSDLAKSAVDFVSQIDQRLKTATNNTVDLKVLLPLGLAIYSFIELESDITTPLWVTLGIFSFNSFIALHRPGGHPMQMDSSEVIQTHPPGQPAETTVIRKRTQKSS
jgi:Heavy metal associated domain 2